MGVGIEFRIQQYSCLRAPKICKSHAGLLSEGKSTADHLTNLGIVLGFRVLPNPVKPVDESEAHHGPSSERLMLATCRI